MSPIPSTTDTLTIREMCEAFAVTPRTLRFYEAKELLFPIPQSTPPFFTQQNPPPPPPAPPEKWGGFWLPPPARFGFTRQRNCCSLSAKARRACSPSKTAR